MQPEVVEEVVLEVLEIQFIHQVKIGMVEVVVQVKFGHMMVIVMVVVVPRFVDSPYDTKISNTSVSDKPLPKSRMVNEFLNGVGNDTSIVHWAQRGGSSP